MTSLPSLNTNWNLSHIPCQIPGICNGSKKKIANPTNMISGKIFFFFFDWKNSLIISEKRTMKPNGLVIDASKDNISARILLRILFFSKDSM